MIMRRHSGRARSFVLLVAVLFSVGCEEPLSGDKIVWVPIPAGSFEMGCSPGDYDCDHTGRGYGETPRHLVQIPAFEMTRTEITQYQYWKVTDERPAYHPECGDCPVEHMPNHYDDAQAFCEAIGGRLPSEAEWEYAARSGTTTRFNCGGDSACLDDISWHRGNSHEGHGWTTKDLFADSHLCKRSGLWFTVGVQAETRVFRRGLYSDITLFRKFFGVG
jgi:formylglycine-generating enzyme required for sulfatase activity